MFLKEDEKNLSQRQVTNGKTIEKNRRRLEEAQENLKAASTVSTAASYQADVHKVQLALGKNIKREMMALLFPQKGCLSCSAKCLIMSMKFSFVKFIKDHFW